MKSTKDIVSDYLKIQKDFVDSFVTSAKEVQGVFGKPEAMDKTREVYNSWLAKQQEIAETFSTTVKEQSNFESAPKFVKELVEAQEGFGKSWFEAFRSVNKSKDTKELSEMLTNNVKKVQENFTTIYEKASERAKKPMNEAKVPTVEETKDAIVEMIDMWKPTYKLN